MKTVVKTVFMESIETRIRGHVYPVIELARERGAEEPVDVLSLLISYLIAAGYKPKENKDSLWHKKHKSKYVTFYDKIFGYEFKLRINWDHPIPWEAITVTM